MLKAFQIQQPSGTHTHPTILLWLSETSLTINKRYSLKLELVVSSIVNTTTSVLCKQFPAESVETRFEPPGNLSSIMTRKEVKDSEGLLWTFSGHDSVGSLTSDPS
eukprot:scaffold81881_cov18-Prasinocladus_malaysianus.AAC.1